MQPVQERPTPLGNSDFLHLDALDDSDLPPLRPPETNTYFRHFPPTPPPASSLPKLPFEFPRPWGLKNPATMSAGSHEPSAPELKIIQPTPTTPTFEQRDPQPKAPDDPGHLSPNSARVAGLSKAVQYAPTARNQAMKAFVGHGKPNFGDLDPRQGLGRIIAPPPGLTPPPGLGGVAFANNPMGYGFGNARSFTPSILRPSVTGPPPGIPTPGHAIAGGATAGPLYPGPPNCEETYDVRRSFISVCVDLNIGALEDSACPSPRRMSFIGLSCTTGN